MIKVSSFSNPWLVFPQPNPDCKLRLLCFPYAGGGTSMFWNWSAHFSPFVEICAVRLPGRETRYQEPAFTDMDLLIEALIDPLLPVLDKPFVFFGHSMGALVSFELARFLRKRYGLTPKQLLVSARRAPQIPHQTPPLFNLPEPDFLEEIRRFNGIPSTILEDRELMQLFLPTLRADFSVLETYQYVSEKLLDCPINVFGGLQDTQVTVEELEAWQEQTLGDFSLQMFPGDHFFLNTASQKKLLESISSILEKILNPGI